MTAKSRRRPAPRADARPAPRPPASSPVALVIAAIVFLTCAAYVMPFIPDDSFISFRYAEHLADGHGLTFNIGEEPVEAYSNLLWIVVCAALYGAGLDLPAVTPYAGILLGLAALYVLWALCRRRAPLWTQQLLPLLAFASCGPFIIYAVSGMETALFAFLLLLVVKCSEDFVDAPGWRPLAALATAGFLVSLTRPEGVVVLPAALAFVAWESRREEAFRRGLRSLAIAAAVFGVATMAYHAWRVSYFGEWLPTPFLSKGAEGSSLVTGWYKNLHRYFVNLLYFAPPQGYLFAAMLGLGIEGVRAARAAGVRAPGDRIALILGLLLFAVYVNFVDWMPGMRYHAPLAAILVVPMSQLHRLLPVGAWESASAAHLRRFAALAAALLLAGGVNLSHLRHATAKMTESARLCYMPLAEWMRATMPPGSLLAMGDVGMVPYYSGLRTLDIHPESLTDTYIAQRAFSADYVMTKRPHVIALSVRGVYSARMDPLHWELYKSEAFRIEYGFVGTVRNQWYEDRAYWIFVRSDLGLSEAQLRALPEGIGKQRRTRFDL
ncbi:MAG TPA: hypothetical protein VFT13_08000 [Candidatus Krumholzibacteria bacterium]|nr:hypothetical protein [Candidatus Krumholzibacteria bacterium]